MADRNAVASGPLHTARNALNFDLDSLTNISVPEDLSGLELADLRALRARLEDVENGLSYARRMVQGRLDTLAIELDRRRFGASEDPRMMTQLPKALSDRTRAQGSPRPPSELEPPEWADKVIAEVDEFLSPAQKADLPSITDEDLSGVIGRIANAERRLSESRHRVHGSIDRIQNELISRYRDGASVDDLLR